MRTLAWWHAVPQHDASDKHRPPRNTHSRQELRERAGNEIDLPPLSPALNHIVHRLFEVGPMSGSDHEQAIAWTDLDAYSRLTGVTLSPWEARLLRSLAAEYLGTMRRSMTMDDPAPWAPSTDASHKAKVAKRISSIFRSK